VRSTSQTDVMIIQLLLKGFELHQQTTNQVNEQNKDWQVNLSQAYLLTSR